MVKNLSAMQETRVWSLVREDPLEKGRASHSSVVAWKIPWTEKPGRLQSVGLQRVGHDWVTNTHTGMKLDSFGKAAVTKHHKQKWMFSQFWRLKVWASEGLAPFEGCEGTSILLLFPSFWWLPGNLWYSLASRSITLISAFIFNHGILFVCICLQISLF